MTQSASPESEPSITRRALVTSAWSLPIVAMAVSTPLTAASMLGKFVVTVFPSTLTMTNDGAGWSGSLTINLLNTAQGPVRGGIAIQPTFSGPIQLASVDTPGWAPWDLRPDWIFSPDTFQALESKNVALTFTSTGVSGDTGSINFEAISVGANTVDVPVILA